MLIDFTELTADQFEECVYELLTAEGHIEVSAPAVGQDRGVDFVVKSRDYNGLETIERVYVVQCKKHSSAVGRSDVPNIETIVTEHGADGYILVVATTVTNGLQQMFQSLQENNTQNRYYCYWDRRNLFQRLTKHRDVFKQYLPDQFERYLKLEAMDITSDIKQIALDSFGCEITDDQVTLIRKEALLAGMSNTEDVRGAISNPEMAKRIHELYQRLLKREPTPYEQMLIPIALSQFDKQAWRRRIEGHILTLPEMRRRIRAIFNFENVPIATAEGRFDSPHQEIYGFLTYHQQYSSGAITIAPPHESVACDKVATLTSTGDKPFRVVYIRGTSLLEKRELDVAYDCDGYFEFYILVRAEDGKKYFVQYIDGKGSDTTVVDSGITYAQVYGAGEKIGPHFFRKCAKFADDLERLCGMKPVELESVIFGVKGRLTLYNIVVD